MNVVMVVYLFRCWYYIWHVVILCITILTYADYMELRNKQKANLSDVSRDGYMVISLWLCLIIMYIFFTYIHTHVFKTRTQVMHKRLERVVEKGVCVLPNALGWESKALRFPWWNDERNVIFEMKMAVAGGMDLIGSHLLVCGCS